MLVTFDVAGQEYALALDAVQEILDTPEALAALPASEALVLGVTPFRDTLLPLLSLRGLLGFTTRAERTDREKIVVTRVGGALVGLLADRMRSIFPADADLIEKIPPVLSARAGGEAKISAIYRGENGRRLVSVLAPEQLFREDVMQRLKASGGSTGEGDREAPASQREERQFLVFRLGDDEFGLPIEAVDEVARVPDQITRLPKTPKFLEGVVNLRGEVLPVVDQRRRFDMPALDERAARRLVVVRTERHKAGLDRRFGVRGVALPGRRDRTGAQPQQRDRQAGPRRGQPRAGRPHRPAARSRRAADARRAWPARHVPGQGGACRFVIKVLVVDDSALMRKLLGRIFSKEADFEVQFARNGLEALEQLAAFKPDVVTLDVHMPQMDGLACLDRIMIERPCPVVMVSSLTAEGAEATLEALRLGAVDFVAKPEGAISLHIDELTDELIAKVRAAATARIRSSARLKERVRHRIGRDAPAIRLEEGRRSGPPNPVDATAGSRGVPSAKGWCWSAPRPAGRRRWKRC